MALFEAIIDGALDDYLSVTIQRNLHPYTNEIGRILYAKYIEITERLTRGGDPYSDSERRRKWRRQLTR